MTTTLNPPERSTIDWLGDLSGLGTGAKYGPGAGARWWAAGEQAAVAVESSGGSVRGLRDAALLAVMSDGLLRALGVQLERTLAQWVLRHLGKWHRELPQPRWPRRRPRPGQRFFRPEPACWTRSALEIAPLRGSERLERELTGPARASSRSASQQHHEEKSQRTDDRPGEGTGPARGRGCRRLSLPTLLRLRGVRGRERAPLGPVHHPHRVRPRPELLPPALSRQLLPLPFLPGIDVRPLPGEPTLQRQERPPARPGRPFAPVPPPGKRSTGPLPLVGRVGLGVVFAHAPFSSCGL